MTYQLILESLLNVLNSRPKSSVAFFAADKALSSGFWSLKKISYIPENYLIILKKPFCA